MTTPKQIKANTKNAKASTGPNTAHGKHVVSRNAIQHGVLSQLPVLPHIERTEDWDRHRIRTLDAILPVGYLEHVLADRVALLSWRLGRITRYEREVTAVAIARVEKDLDRQYMKARLGILALDAFDDLCDPPPVQSGAEQAFERAQALVAVLQLTAKAGSASCTVDGEDAASMFDAACDLTHVRYWEDESEGKPDMVLPGLPLHCRPEDHDWTVTTVRVALKAIADHAGIPVKDLLRSMRQQADRRLAAAIEHQERVAHELDQQRRLRILPDADTRDRLARYEAHLERSLYRALHELQRLQAARGGTPIPPPIAVDVTIAGTVGSKTDTDASADGPPS